MTTVLAIASGLCLVAGALTAVGARRRGSGPASCAVQAMFFPLTWVGWFVADNRRAGRRAFQGR